MSAEVPLWVTCVNVFLDVFVILTLPLYIVFMKQLKVNKEVNIYNNGFVFILYANGFCDITSSVVNIFINEFPQRGIFSAFYVNDPLWKARVSKAFQLGVQFYQLFSLIIVVVNRWFVVKKPVIYITLFSSRNMLYLYSILYCCTIVYIAPIFVFAGATIYNENGVHYYGFFESPKIVLVYGISYLVLALIAFIVWIIAYVQISCFITRHEKYELNQGFRRRKINKSLIRVTAASFIFTLGTIFQFVIQFSNDLAWRFFGVTNLYPVLTLLTLTRIGQEMANLSQPWFMILLSPEMSNGMRAVLGLKPTGTRVIQIQQHQQPFHTKSTFRAVFPSSTVAAIPMRVKI